MSDPIALVALAIAVVAALAALLAAVRSGRSVAPDAASIQARFRPPQITSPTPSPSTSTKGSLAERVAGNVVDRAPTSPSLFSRLTI